MDQTTDDPIDRPGGEPADAPAGLATDDVIDARRAHPPAPDALTAIVEALIFASPEPLTARALYKLLEDDPAESVDAALAALEGRYADGGGGLQLVQVANGYQIVTRSELHEWVRRLFHERTTQKLSVAALETLAVIAYKQPITAAEIAEIRGVNTAGVLGTLLDRKLIKIAGRKAVVGRPFMYATTRDFLDRFGLKDLGDLPRVEDMADVLGFDLPAMSADLGGTLPFDRDADIVEPPAGVAAAEPAGPPDGASPAEVATEWAEGGQPDTVTAESGRTPDADG
jgi:segregation and condensation protein B